MSPPALRTRGGDIGAVAVDESLDLLPVVALETVDKDLDVDLAVALEILSERLQPFRAAALGLQRRLGSPISLTRGCGRHWHTDSPTMCPLDRTLLYRTLRALTRRTHRDTSA
jgi:hypothetical protein